MLKFCVLLLCAQEYVVQKPVGQCMGLLRAPAQKLAAPPYSQPTRALPAKPMLPPPPSVAIGYSASIFKYPPLTFTFPTVCFGISPNYDRAPPFGLGRCDSLIRRLPFVTPKISHPAAPTPAPPASAIAPAIAPVVEPVVAPTVVPAAAPVIAPTLAPASNTFASLAPLSSTLTSLTISGQGVGNIKITGDLPVTGMTVVTGCVPILGAVNFGGEVRAHGNVKIVGSCGCGEELF